MRHFRTEGPSQAVDVAKSLQVGVPGSTETTTAIYQAVIDDVWGGTGTVMALERDDAGDGYGSRGSRGGGGKGVDNGDATIICRAGIDALLAERRSANGQGSTRSGGEAGDSGTATLIRREGHDAIVSRARTAAVGVRAEIARVVWQRHRLVTFGTPQRNAKVSGG